MNESVWGRTLDRTVHMFEGLDGINVEKLIEGDVVTVFTRNTIYTFTIERPHCREARVVSNGKLFKTPALVTIQGACYESHNKSTLYLGRILAGPRLEFHSKEDDLRVWTSLVDEIWVNGHKVAPIHEEAVH